VPAVFCETRLARNPRLAGIKHLNRLEQVLAQSELPTGTGAEGIVCDTSGYVIETCRANLFACFGAELVTPDLKQAGVAGVMRAEVMARAADAGIAVREAVFTPRELLAADEVFVTNAVIGVRPIRALGERELRTGPLTQRVQALLSEVLAP
jgi:4-amino-4-deoxychorismate lyase